MVVWWGSSIECASAIARLHRELHLTDQEERSATATLAVLRRSWFEVQPGDSIRDQALRLLRVHKDSPHRLERQPAREQRAVWHSHQVVCVTNTSSPCISEYDGE